MHCSDFWRNTKQFGPIRIGWGQICEDPSSWIMWVRVNKLYIGFIPARCYWKMRLTGWNPSWWILGGGQIKGCRGPKIYSLYFGPLDLSIQKGWVSHER